MSRVARFAFVSTPGVIRPRASRRRGAVTPRAARPDRRPENASGPFFVDHTCIDCDACRWLAPGTFTRVGGMSAVTTQPRDNDARATALRALLSCPTSSIHLDAPADEVKRAHEDFPRRLRLPADDDDAATTSSTSGFRAYHLGFHSRRSYGAAPYLIALPRGRGCVMVDCPRWTPSLAARLRDPGAFGPVLAVILTHKDDVADHERWAAALDVPRVLHAADVTPGTRDVEHKLEGNGPWTVRASGADGDPAKAAVVDLAGGTPTDADRELLLVHTPGHTAGCVSVFCAPLRALFTGDHLCGRGGETELGDARASRLTAMPRYCWGDWSEQRRSVEKLVGLEFDAVFPGHGRPATFEGGVEEKDEALRQLLANEPE